MTEYSTVTELPGAMVAPHALSMTCTRYRFAAPFCTGKDVLEVACGGGQGLGYLAQSARSVVGSDIDAQILGIAEDYYHKRPGVALQQADAQALPFADGKFDVIVFFEALYYVPNLREALAEFRRVLRKDGRLIICSVNPEWSGFNPSPHSVKYYTIAELQALLLKCGFTPEFFTAYEDDPDRLSAKLKRFAVKWGLMPKTMRGKKLFKRLFYGKLLPFPNEVSEGMGDDEPLKPHVKGEDISKRIVYYVSAVMNPASPADGREPEEK